MESLLLRWYDRHGSGPAVAPDARPVRDPRQRDDAAADPGRSGHSALPRVARAVADGRIARRRDRCRRDPGLARVRLQPAGARTPSRGPTRSRATGGPTISPAPGVGPYTAAAISNFALGRNVLPHDVNVDRVERRTRQRSAGAAAQALMDLGATVCLARIPRCDACPLAGEMPVAGHPGRTETEAGPVRGLVSRAPGRHAAARRRRR